MTHNMYNIVVGSNMRNMQFFCQFGCLEGAEEKKYKDKDKDKKVKGCLSTTY